VEIERKFLVDRLPDDLSQYPHAEIEQGYLCTSPTVRIRKLGEQYWLTIKEKVSNASVAIHNREEEFRLSEDKYMHLKSKCDGRMVHKTRYKIPIGELTAELDVFHGRHEGLVIVEVEFPDTVMADSFVKPDWFGADVSLDKRYRNSHLAFVQ